MTFSNPYQTYKKQDILTSNPREIVSKLYSAAVVNLRRAVIDIQHKHIEGAHNSIVKTEKIIAVLDTSLDMNYEISTQLHQLYDYMKRRLREGNLKKDTEILNEIAGMLVELRDAWDEARVSAK